MLEEQLKKSMKRYYSIEVLQNTDLAVSKKP